MTPEQLKASILQYAIQGKLVEQRPEEGIGEELYRQIQAEKQRLIKEGKIKKEKSLLKLQMTRSRLIFQIVGSGSDGVTCLFQYNTDIMLRRRVLAGSRWFA